MKYLTFILFLLICGCSTVQSVPEEKYEGLISSQCMKKQKLSAIDIEKEKYCQAVGIGFMVAAKRAYSKIARRELDDCIFNKHSFKNTNECFMASQDRFYLKLINARK